MFRGGFLTLEESSDDDILPLWPTGKIKIHQSFSLMYLHEMCSLSNDSLSRSAGHILQSSSKHINCCHIYGIHMGTWGHAAMFHCDAHGERPNCAVEIRWAVQEWCTMYVYVYIWYHEDFNKCLHHPHPEQHQHMKGKKDLDYKVYGIIKLLSSSDGGTPTEIEMLRRMKVMIGTEIRHRCAAIRPFSPATTHTHTDTSTSSTHCRSQTFRLFLWFIILLYF